MFALLHKAAVDNIEEVLVDFFNIEGAADLVREHQVWFSKSGVVGERLRSTQSPSVNASLLAAMQQAENEVESEGEGEDVAMVEGKDDPMGEGEDE